MTYYEIVSGLLPNYWWKLNGNENDSVGGLNSNGGTDPAWVNSIIPSISGTSQCGDYDGSGSVSHLPDASDINMSTTYKKSISVWFNADTIDTTGNGRIIWEEGGGTNWISLYTYNDDGTNKVFISVGEGGASGNVDYVVGSIATGSTYHCGVSLDFTNQSLYIYLNGSLVDSKTGGLNIGNSLSSHSSDPAIGGDDGAPRNHAQATCNGHFDGKIADVAYWAEPSSVLDSTRFGSIYDAGNPQNEESSSTVINYHIS